MAGRGTDIMLGGNAEFLAVQEMKAKGLDPVETPDEYEAEWDAVYQGTRDRVAEEATKVVEAGGLYVLGTERHESRRIDNQLRGRSGRQGDPGESRFYLSLTDDLMRLFQSGAAEAILARTNFPDDVAIESTMVSRAIKSAQSQVEARNAEIRKNVLKYDDVLNRQREAIYSDRRHILAGRRHRRPRAALHRGRDQRRHRRPHRRGPHRELGLRRALDRAEDPLPRGRDDRRGRRRGAGPRAGITADGLKREILSDAMIAYEQARGDARRGRDARARAPRRAAGARPPLARPPLRDGLPQGRHRPARHGPARPAHRVPARGLPDVPGDDGADQGGVGRLPLQPRGRGAPSGRGRGEPPRSRPRASAPHPVEGQRLQYSAPNDAGEVEVRNDRGQVQQAATSRLRQAAAQLRAPRLPPQAGRRGVRAERSVSGRMPRPARPPPLRRTAPSAAPPRSASSASAGTPVVGLLAQPEVHEGLRRDHAGQ